MVDSRGSTRDRVYVLLRQVVAMHDDHALSPVTVRSASGDDFELLVLAARVAEDESRRAYLDAKYWNSATPHEILVANHLRWVRVVDALQGAVSSHLAELPDGIDPRKESVPASRFCEQAGLDDESSARLADLLGDGVKVTVTSLNPAGQVDEPPP